MSDCPPCVKVVLNGGIAARVLDETCYVIKEHLETEGEFSDIQKLVLMANELENKAFAFTKEVLTQIGFTGPWPKSMS